MTHTPLVTLPEPGPEPGSGPGPDPAPNDPAAPFHPLYHTAAVVNDALPAATSLTSTAFDIASSVTRASFSVAEATLNLASAACLVGAEQLASPVLLVAAGSIQVARSAVSLSSNVSLAAQSASKSIAIVSLKTAAATFDVAGVKDGDGVRLFISDDDVAAAQFIQSMVVSFLAEVPPNVTLPELYEQLGHLALLHRSSQTGLPSSLPLTPKTVSPDVKRYVRFAVAIYGHLPTAFLRITETDPSNAADSTSDNASLSAFCRITATPPAAILLHSLTGATYSPGYIVSLDSAMKTILVTIRGTIAFPADVLTDLVCGVKELPEYRGVDCDAGAHAGMLESARRLDVAIAPTVLAAISANEGFRVLVTGHSLGAGVATLLAVLWGEKMGGASVNCIAYAPPCVLTLKVARECRGWVESVVCGGDVVSRFGLATMVDLREALLTLRTRGGTVPSMSWLLDNVMTETPKLYPGGAVSWLDTMPGGEGGAATVYSADNAVFDHIALQKGMYSSHMPQFYLKEVEKL